MGNIVPGLEVLDGGAAGDKVSVSVPPEKGYGVRDESLIQVLTKDQFAGVDELEVETRFMPILKAACAYHCNHTDRKQQSDGRRQSSPGRYGSAFRY